jgi:8-oxo-dGTP diphosphatase
MKIDRFNIRVYGLLVHEGNILVTDEYRLGVFMTKFPGGALEFGEGTLDCLKREFMEELGIEIDILQHFYTTDYFQPTTLLPSTMQLINIYYIVNTKHPEKILTSAEKFDFPTIVDGAQSFRWAPLAGISEDDVTFPIDKRVIPMIVQHFK